MKPILFSTPMVRAIQDDRKNQTRRVTPLQESLQMGYELLGYILGTTGSNKEVGCFKFYHEKFLPIYLRPKYQAGDVLWVRETWTPFCINKKTCRDALLSHADYCYKASPEECVDSLGCKWKPSIFMPKEAARIFLKVTNVRVERLQDITEEDAIREGFMPEPLGNCSYHVSCLECDSYPYNSLGAGKETITRDEGCCLLARDRFADLWDSLNAKRDGGIYAWEKNPWVFVYEFERVKVK